MRPTTTQTGTSGSIKIPGEEKLMEMRCQPEFMHPAAVEDLQTLRPEFERYDSFMSREAIPNIWKKNYLILHQYYVLVGVCGY
jgi:hypothetical protein